MKKTLLLGTALLVGVAGFAQSTAKKVVNTKYAKKISIINKTRVVEGAPSTSPGIQVPARKNSHASTATVACDAVGTTVLTTSWNCFGVGGGVTTSSQNCLTYNADLNCLLWTQRGSNTWPTQILGAGGSGYMQATIIDANTLAKDSVITYHDGGSSHDARFPSGVFMNPTKATSYTNAIAVSMGQVTNGTNWTGAAYVAKPLWSKSALTHTSPTADSSYAVSTALGVFGLDANANLTGAPANDTHTMPDGKTVFSIGTVDDASLTSTSVVAGKGAIIAKGVLNAAGTAVAWTYTTIIPPVHKGAFGYNLSEGRMAFGPSGKVGYVVFNGILNTAYGTTSDSAMTPILYMSVDSGKTWTQKLAGYDWMCHHPEVVKNSGELHTNPQGEVIPNKRFYTFDEGLAGCDLVVDANDVLHYVSCVSESSFLTGDLDSVGIYSSPYQYDYLTHHPIIWDFMTDGNGWSTMMVDSIMSAACGQDASVDSTSINTSMGGAEPLSVTAHITVSRSLDGTKIFYGRAESDPGSTSVLYNISPDLVINGYDLTTGLMSDTTVNASNYVGTAFYPYLSEYSYFDGSNWVVPGVYTTGNKVLVTTPQITYDASSQANYFLTTCGTFDIPSMFHKHPVITTGMPNDPCLPPLGIQKYNNNAFESAIGNYPNPFNNTTTISVTLAESKNVNVKVYNAIGTLVYSKSVNGNVGQNTVSFDGSALSSGVYYYTVTAGNDQATKKMIIQK